MKHPTLLELLCSRYPDIPKDTLYSYILCREIEVDGGRIADPGVRISPDAEVAICRERFVSRGGLKLQCAIDTWDLQVSGKVFIDAGSSTGGFTDALLQAGAAQCFAVDVGYNQLHYKLRRDPRVTVMERTNIMHVNEFHPDPHAAVADLSFRSIQGAAGKVLSLTTEGWMVVLLKPQFEIRGMKGLEFDGVVKDISLLRETLTETLELLVEEQAWPAGIIESPITGRKGNREFLVLLVDGKRKQTMFEPISPPQMQEIVESF